VQQALRGNPSPPQEATVKKYQDNQEEIRSPWNNGSRIEVEPHISPFYIAFYWSVVTICFFCETMVPHDRLFSSMRHHGYRPQYFPVLFPGSCRPYLYKGAGLTGQ
jgi:hypothetical protein